MTFEELKQAWDFVAPILVLLGLLSCFVFFDGIQLNPNRPCSKCKGMVFTVRVIFLERFNGGPDDLCNWVGYTETLACKQCGRTRKRKGVEPDGGGSLPEITSIEPYELQVSTRNVWMFQ